MVTIESKEAIKVPGTNLDKVLWPDEGYTKKDLIHYYSKVFTNLIPYLQERPLVVTRYPSGIKGKWFYQKNAPAGTPEWVRTFPWFSSHSQRYLNFIICDRLETMLWLANQACIELHPWMSPIHHLDKPDFVVFDLDPSAESTYEDVLDVAEALHEILRHLGLRSYPKTSGATGLHILVPTNNEYTYDELRDFVRVIAEMVVQLVPSQATVVRKVKDRQGKVYVDYLQNIRGQTVCAPYSLRPLPGAPVSTPFSWDELRHIKTGDFNMISVPLRLEQMGDPLAHMITDPQSIKASWQQLKAAFHPVGKR
ncbi:MAG: DNA polymerase domain-containing protein [Syntrophomonadaceae bacterium]|nr:DNA polymerase domain-containing protein [Syntrophomonadaceae bacterium]